MRRCCQVLTLVSLCVCICVVSAFADPVFKVGFGKRDVTPTKPMPMWGYGARHAALSVGIMDPLYAKAAVIDVGTGKLALVGLDLGRSPTAASMAVIRDAVKKAAGVDTVMIVGSHTHSGPVIELLDEPGKGKGTFDDAVAYVKLLEKGIIEAITDAAAHTQDAKIGWGSAKVPMNRNRQAKIAPKVTDPELSVVRFDDTTGKPIALMVNFAAHPVTRDGADLRYSADYPGQMMNAVEAELKTNCFFMEGSAGDMSPNPPEGVKGTEAFGKSLGAEVLKINKDITTTVPAKPSIQAKDEDFAFTSRVDFLNPFTVAMFRQAFFPELAEASLAEMKDGQLHPHLTTVLLNGQLALVGASGEFFCQHSLRLKERSRADKTIFFGYCNGHHMYFPTIEAAAEGGYGASPTVSWVELGGPEKMMNQALINIYTMLGGFPLN